jgi:hypothetical protein
MKKLLAIFVLFSLIVAATPAVLANFEPIDDENEAEYLGGADSVQTIAEVAGSSSGGGGSTGGTGNEPPIIKAKWEYDLCVQLCPDQCDPLCCYEHDADPYTPGLQVKPILGGSVLVGYFAVVTDPQGISTVDSVYADIWHPDGEFKYQIELHPVGFDTGVYDKTVALGIWDHVEMCHFDLIKINQDWVDFVLPPGMDPFYDIWDELNEELAYIYYGEAEISYCQPGGYYCVGVRGHDTFGAWSDYLFNCFWYIPTAAIQTDFDTINYGTVVITSNKWVGGDPDMTTPAKPTIRNIGNTPVGLYVWQDDMQFGQTDGLWNVVFDARLSADGDVVVYDPYDHDLGYPGVRIPGVLPLCDKEKLDFSIHVQKGFPGYTYVGELRLFALIEGSPAWTTPGIFVGSAPLGVEQFWQCCIDIA